MRLNSGRATPSNQELAPSRDLRYHLDVLKSLLHTLALLCALLPQCLFATLAPALVVCQEAAGAEVLELGLTDCCQATVGETGGEEGVREQGEGCEDCSDSALSLSLRSDDLQGQDLSVTAVRLPESPAWSWRACGPPQGPIATHPRPSAVLQALRTVIIRC